MNLTFNLVSNYIRFGRVFQFSFINISSRSLYLHLPYLSSSSPTSSVSANPICHLGQTFYLPLVPTARHDRIPCKSKTVYHKFIIVSKYFWVF